MLVVSIAYSQNRGCVTSMFPSNSANFLYELGGSYL